VVAVLALLVVPVARDRDSFPLSRYPMYAGTRPDADVFATATGRRADGRVRSLSPHAIAGTDDPLIAMARVRSAISAGRAGELCADIAARVPPDVVAVEVVEERHDLVAQVSGETSLLDREIHARCQADR
jgi:hypothetical protein